MSAEEKIAHLGFIQGVITRMAGNCFLLKGWSVTLVAGLFALAADGSDRKFAAITLGAILLFWVLDAYYFHQEKLYRELYKRVAADDASVPAFSLDASAMVTDKPGFWHRLLDGAVMPFHALIGLVALLALVDGVFCFL